MLGLNILEKIIIEKEKEVQQLKDKKFEHLPAKNIPTFHEQIKQATKMSIIAEIKRASPSKGPIQMNVDPVKQAKKYEALGASAISVLTDQPFFNGSMEDLKAIRTAVKLPILCKDFIIDPIQIDQAKAAGANIILLIVAALEEEALKELYTYAKQLELEVLVEVHNEEEMKRALQIGAQLIGVNNRDLKSFTVDLTMTEKLSKMVTDPNVIFISESGLQTKEDVKRVAAAGAEAILVGETFMRSKDLAKTFAQFQISLPKRRKNHAR